MTDNVFEEGFDGNVQTIMQSFIFKIVEKLNPTFEMEHHLNARSILCELVEYKQVYTELKSQRCLELYKQYLASDSISTK